MSVKVLYKTTAKATGGRDGTAATIDGAFNVKLATPKELGGGGGAGNNPEQLFAAGYAACFIGAMKAVGRGRREGARGRLHDSSVSLGPRTEAPGLDIELAISLPGLERGSRGAGGHRPPGCPYSNATRGNVDVRLTVVILAMARSRQRRAICLVRRAGPPAASAPIRA